ncbi:hypothetical protein R3P38DRAFT_3508508 [Favolaschia claudopus]|uniref:Reverse transcriptase zinc-binding domain-containing protein n=1 Tax=Favolaschia claudopus TaxID=2862362 RepID=A0AAV9Z1Q9_9AGAR
MPRPLPPVQTPSFLGEPPSSPPGISQPSSTSATAGIQLCVSGLPYEHANSAAAHFKTLFPQILLDSRQKNPDRALPEWEHLSVTPANVKHAADFVLVAVHENVAPEPRPDLLHNLILAIRDGTNLTVDWTTGTGRDRPRIVNYKMQSKADAEAMEPLVKKYLKEHNITVISSTVGEFKFVGARISFDLAALKDVEELCKGEIIVKGRSLTCTAPRFNFQASMDHAVTQALGPNCILSSYMDLDGDVYGVALRKWDDVQKLQNIRTPQPAGVPMFHTLSPFIPIYFFNNRSAPASPTALMVAAQANSEQQTAQFQSLQSQVQMMMEQGIQTMGTVAQVVRSQNKVIESVNKSNAEIRNAIAVMHARSLASNELTYIRGEVSRLRSDKGNKEMMLMIADTDDKRKSQFHKLREMITSFEFPSLRTRLPLTAARRVVTQQLMSRLRPHLSFQPLLPKHAEQLDALLRSKIHELFSLPFPFNPSLLSLPLRSLGFDFPSIYVANGIAAIQGLMRDLNHHITLFRTMAHISLADWTCGINQCRHPFDGSSTLDSFLRQTSNLPTAWITAHCTLRDAGISVRATDLSHFSTGNVSLIHIYNALPIPLRGNIPRSLLTSLTGVGVIQLRDAASWDPPEFPSTYIPVLIPKDRSEVIPAQFRTRLAFTAWNNIEHWLRLFSMQSLLEAVLGHRDVVRSPNFVDSDGLPRLSQGLVRDPPPLADLWTLAMPRTSRQQYAEAAILALSRPRPAFPAFSSSPVPHVAASDGSQVPAAATFRVPRSVTFAAVAPHGTVQGSLDSMGASANIAAAEIYGLITATLLLSHSLPHAPPPPATAHLPGPPSPTIRSSPRIPSAPPSPANNIIYTDHLNSVRLLHSSLQSPFLPHSWDFVPNRSLYRWLRSLFTLPKHPSLPPRRTSLPFVLLPSQFRPSQWTPSCSTPPVDRYVDSALLPYLHHALMATRPILPRLQLSSLYSPYTPPEHPYFKASSSFSALTQLYARSAQLPTAVTLHKRGMLPNASCRKGCPVAETEHHIFVQCPAFASYRDHATAAVVLDTSRYLNDADVPLKTVREYTHLARRLFRDSASFWPQILSQYYLGLIPSWPPIHIPNNSPSDTQKIESTVFKIWHLASIRLAGRIWGEVLRHSRRGEKRMLSADDRFLETAKQVKGVLLPFMSSLATIP